MLLVTQADHYDIVFFLTLNIQCSQQLRSWRERSHCNWKMPSLPAIITMRLVILALDDYALSLESPHILILKIMRSVCF
jgi:hypothetical protein